MEKYLQRPLQQWDTMGSSGHKHRKGEKVSALVDNHGYVLSPLTVAPVNERWTWGGCPRD